MYNSLISTRTQTKQERFSKDICAKNNSLFEDVPLNYNKYYSKIYFYVSIFFSKLKRFTKPATKD